MGWLCYDINTNPKVEMDRVYNWDSKDENGNLTKKVSVLRSCVKGSHYYAAVKVENFINNTEQITAVCCLTYYNPRVKKDYNFGYKSMDETMGPFMYSCPETILNLLTPTDNKCALEWREACRREINKRKTLNKLPYGALIKFKFNGEDMILQKHMHFNKPRWENFMYYFKVSNIPQDFEILN